MCSQINQQRIKHAWVTRSGASRPISAGAPGAARPVFEEICTAPQQVSDRVSVVFVFGVICLEAGKNRLLGDTQREATSTEVTELPQGKRSTLGPRCSRTARTFTSMLLYQREYDFKYLSEFSDYYNEHRDEYYAALRSADRSGDYTEWITFFLGGFSDQMVRTQALVRNGVD